MLGIEFMASCVRVQEKPPKKTNNHMYEIARVLY